MPENEVVKIVASYMEIKGHGILEWKEPNPFNLYGTFLNNYISDNEQFKYPPYDDYWINPDYYFINGMRGDCEDGALAVASILKNKGVDIKIVGGYLIHNDQHIRDWIVEYKIDNEYYRYFGGAFNVGFVHRDFKIYNVGFEPILMFDDSTYYGYYNKNW